MTIKGWMVVFGAVIVGIILASCSKSNHDNGNQSSRKLSCSEQTAFISSGVSYVPEGDRLVAYNGQGQRIVLSEQESRAGYMFDHCQGNQGANQWNGGGNYQRDERRERFEHHRE